MLIHLINKVHRIAPFISETMSRAVASTPNKVAVKKAQGQLKTFVTTYGMLINGWQSDVAEIIKLVQYYKGLVSKNQSIQKTVDEKSHFIKSIPDNEFVGDKLMALVHLDMESTLLQIKTFE